MADQKESKSNFEVRDGAVAKGKGAKSTGKRGIQVDGDVTGATINSGVLYQFYISTAGKKLLDEADFGRILHDYLVWVRSAYGKARLYGLESLRTTPDRPKRELVDIFIPLSLQRFAPPSRDEVEEKARQFLEDDFAEQKAFLSLVEERRKQSEPIPLKSLLTLKDRLAIVGGAGCGKSTLLAYLAAALAELELSGAELSFDLPAQFETLVPLVIPLRYRREYLRLCAAAPLHSLEHARAGTLAGFILWYLKKRSQALKAEEDTLAEDFFDRLLRGGGCLVMLDGLDEVVNQTERSQVRSEVEKLADEIYPHNRFLVTAREAGYTKDAVFSDDFLRLDVMDLESKQIQALVENWCRQLYPDQFETQVEDITQAIQAINQRYIENNLPPLICTPLLTTMVISVKWGKTELPRERARLYEAVVQVILQAQYIDDDPVRQELINWGGDWEEQREWLSSLALEMQRGGQAGAAVPEIRVRQILAHELPADSLEQFIQAVRSRGGLFEERAELFQFVHLTFQEFLASRRLAKDREQSLVNLGGYIEDPWWRETLLLLYGFARADYAPFARKYLQWLSTREAGNACALAGLELAGTAVLEIEKSEPELRLKQAKLLVEAIENSESLAPAILRWRAGDTLARLGDPRFDTAHWYLPNEPLLGFVEIPAGEFLMGSDPETDPKADDDEKPQHTVHLPTYYLARYPVTVAQFQAFVRESDYRPQDVDSLEGLPNHPVVLVTWHDALKYCDWLGEKLKEEAQKQVRAGSQEHFWLGLLNEKLRVSLPSEAEWEKAARGRDGRIYPWGERADLECANYAETRIGTTSAVGCFPKGASPYRLLDMSGNAWEWTRSLWGEDWEKPSFKYPYHREDGREALGASNRIQRVVRGGGFSDRAGCVRCAFRYWDSPLYGLRDYGFRVVVSPLDSVL